ncbi:MAG: (Fe-S)-binding protein [Myxococcota bacterium]|nr:(Fe-S)-binding protein [Myxococcota bacterium]
MAIIQAVLIVLAIVAGASSAGYIAWTRRLKHVWPKRGEIKIVNQAGLWTGIWEVISQKKVIANRPGAGIFHFAVFYGFVMFGTKSVTHILNGLLNLSEPIHLGPFDYVLDFFAVAVLSGVIALAIRRYTVMRNQLTHMLESGIVLLLIGSLMITYLVERYVPGMDNLDNTGAMVNWWIHTLILCGFPSLIAYGKHFHLVVGPVNVVLKHMTELPSDRFIPGSDLDMSDEDADDDYFEAELARVGMPNGVMDYSFHTLFDPAACIECGRCNDACPSAEAGLAPRDHFVLSFRDPEVGEEAFVELVPPDILSTCTQCRACDNVCPVGNRPSRAGLEIRSRMTAAGHYPPRALKDTGASPVSSTGNIFAADSDDRNEFIEANNIPFYDAEEHDILFILGCQGSYSPDVRPVVVATARLLEAAGVKYGVLEDETCWGEGLLHGGGVFEDWPFYKIEKVEELSDVFEEDHSKKILTICPHCKDNVSVQLSAAAEQMGKAPFTGVMSHIKLLTDLVAQGKLKVNASAETVAVHHPCKTIHNDETAIFDGLLSTAGVTGLTAGKDPDVPSCCGGGGGGFLWDSPAKVSKNRFAQIMEDTKKDRIVTGCSGCHRMLAVAKDEKTQVDDIATILLERLEGGAPKSEEKEEEPAPAK